MSSSSASHTMHRLNSRGTVPRNLTCQVDFGGHLPFVKAANLIEDAFGTNAIRCIMPFGKGRYQVSFTSARHVASAICDGIRFENKVIRMTPIEQKTVTLILKNCPIEIHPDDIEVALAPYGKMTRHEFIIDETRGWLKGPRKIQMEMKTPVPNLLKIGVYSTMVQYPGVVEMCARCTKEGHLSFECEEEYCHRCKKYEGHRARDCPRNYKNRQMRADEIDNIIDELTKEQEIVKITPETEEQTNQECEGFPSLLDDLILSDDEVDLSKAPTPNNEREEIATANTSSPSKEKKSFAETANKNKNSPQRTSRSVTTSPTPDTIIGDFSSVGKKKKNNKKVIKRARSATPLVHRQEVIARQLNLEPASVTPDHPLSREGLRTKLQGAMDNPHKEPPADPKQGKNN